jgi:CRP/FNR family transcriptional regulator, cyclic AMP receptor protein
MFDVAACLETEGPLRNVAKYRRGQVVFAQGEGGDDVKYLQKGAIKLSVLSRTAKEAVVAMLVPGDFFGEGRSRVKRFASAPRRRSPQAVC